MPGANCSVYGCHTSRYSHGIAIFSLPKGQHDFTVQWRKKLSEIISKDRLIDSALRKQIASESLHICERHFKEDEVNRNSTRARLIPGTLPSQNLPIKSVQTTSLLKKTRLSTLSITSKKDCNESGKVQNHIHYFYKSFQEFVDRVSILKLESWELVISKDLVKVFKVDNIHLQPQYEVYVQPSLIFTIRSFAWNLPDTHDIYLNYKQSVKNITLSSIIALLSTYSLCQGVASGSNCFKKHILTKLYNPSVKSITTFESEFNKSTLCFLLINSGNICNKCKTLELSQNAKLQKALKRKAETLTKPAHINAPISITSPDRIKLTLQSYRSENAILKQEMKSMQDEIQKNALRVTSDFDGDIKNLMSNAFDLHSVSPFMKFFWTEQQKYLLSNPTSVRYHPMIIRYCLSFCAKSPSAYEDIPYDKKSGTGFLVLPSRRHLCDYKNYIHPQRGFNLDIIKELKSKVKDFSDVEKYIVLLFDEIKIQENLLWDKHTGEIIGFVDLGDINLYYATLQKIDAVATHVLVFMICSIVNPFKFTLANFPLFWKAVGICEMECKLKVMATTCDGASSNRKFFKMHSRLSNSNVKKDVVLTYKTINLYCPERYIYFIADPPNLLKTTRNCIYSSGSGKCTRYMWNDGLYILWSHIADIFKEDQICGLHLLPKLSYDHIKLSSYSVMNVKLAAQVLSTTVSKVLLNYGSPDTFATANFCSMIDSFFDIMNISNPYESIQKSKPFSVPFSSLDDNRLNWLKAEFLPYFEKWLSSINTRQGKFTLNDKGKMFISWQTYEGIKITVNSAVELITFLLSNGVSYVLTERFCQDSLENYFGHQRQIGSRKDNPSVRDFGYNDNTIRNQKVFRPIKDGNSHEDIHFEMNEEPVPCRKRVKTSLQ
nr:uncharacterized protein LOC124807816 [Hydra vulgaris]XP_047126213.1 uncharacterized protein LOC124807816 [Hydra vulgaris]XP_047126214.1 uncharacterized protein LOC124807816 [Hydra vulgaris]XP_047126215.1 uncharacterized protein LOC124807816 [Hydra vulgaris]XP_047126216.1 uncharacterized protein LOC124807816 [Hydra vulgaris]XP_047126217.1 uncharacterized protein LOC124807816 [Hydra vulgaris]XP_047126218.1 uncharacterized protein LOC124807816 [Hydra vulgaris]XP_047126219.1 uncharacterized p